MGVSIGELKGETEVVRDKKYMWTVIGCCTLAWMFDGLDQLIFSMVAPWIMKDWHLTTVEIGLIGSFFLIGHSLGQFFSSTTADYIGRKPMLWLTPIIYSVFTGLSGLSKGVYSMGVLRMLSGLGTGGQHPIGIAMVGENVPAKSRGFYTALMNSGYPLGFLLAILLTSTLGAGLRAQGYGEWSWKWCFIVGAIPGLIIAAVIMKVLKESPLWLKMRAERKAKGIKSFTVFDLFKAGQLRRTMTCIIIYVGALMSYWGIVTWAPTYIATQRGIAIKAMAGYMVFWAFGAWIGQASAGWFMDKLGRKPVLTFYFLGVAVSSLFYGWATSPTVLFWVGPISGFFVLGCSGPMGAYATELFPTSMRATGIGFSGGVARLAAIITPTLVGLIAVKFGIGAGFYLFFGIMIVTTILFLAIGPETKGKELE
jgi:putative MFS transporter